MLAMLLIVVSPYDNLRFGLNKGVVDMLLSHQFLDEWEVFWTVTPRADKVFIYQFAAIGEHKETHGFLVDIDADNIVVGVFLTDDGGDASWRQPTDTCY